MLSMGGSMNRLAQLLIAVFSLLFFIPAQASLDPFVGQCAIFADEDSTDKKEEGTEKPKEEEEPDCD